MAQRAVSQAQGAQSPFATNSPLNPAFKANIRQYLYNKGYTPMNVDKLMKDFGVDDQVKEAKTNYWSDIFNLAVKQNQPYVAEAALGQIVAANQPVGALYAGRNTSQKERDAYKEKQQLTRAQLAAAERRNQANIKAAFQKLALQNQYRQQQQAQQAQLQLSLNDAKFRQNVANRYAMGKQAGLTGEALTRYALGAGAGSVGAGSVGAKGSGAGNNKQSGKLTEAEKKIANTAAYYWDKINNSGDDISGDDVEEFTNFVQKEAPKLGDEERTELNNLAGAAQFLWAKHNALHAGTAEERTAFEDQASYQAQHNMTKDGREKYLSVYNFDGYDD